VVRSSANGLMLEIPDHLFISESLVSLS
jgi:hypothetical protein